MLLFDQRLGNAAKVVFGALATHAGKDGTCWPSATRLAEQVGMARSHFQQALADLERCGWLTRTPRVTHATGPRQTSNFYMLHFDNRPPQKPRKSAASMRNRVRPAGQDPVHPGGQQDTEARRHSDERDDDAGAQRNDDVRAVRPAGHPLSGRQGTHCPPEQTPPRPPGRAPGTDSSDQTIDQPKGSAHAPSALPPPDDLEKSLISLTGSAAAAHALLARVNLDFEGISPKAPDWPDDVADQVRLKWLQCRDELVHPDQRSSNDYRECAWAGSRLRLDEHRPGRILAWVMATEAQWSDLVNAPSATIRRSFAEWSAKNPPPPKLQLVQP